MLAESCDIIRRWRSGDGYLQCAVFSLNGGHVAMCVCVEGRGGRKEKGELAIWCEERSLKEKGSQGERGEFNHGEEVW